MGEIPKPGGGIVTNEEINIAVARKLGLNPMLDNLGFMVIQREDGGVIDLPKYCTSIAAAWEIADEYNISIIKTNQGHWYAIHNFGLSELSQDEWYFSASENGIGTLADTAPMAIALCFLKLP